MLSLPPIMGKTVEIFTSLCYNFSNADRAINLKFILEYIMKKQRLSFKKRIVAAVILLLLIGTIYNIYDNNRFLVAEQDIFLSDLPESFDNYRIL